MRRFGMTSSNTIAFLALFLALGGISYAASTLPKNSVGTGQLKKNAVTTTDIKKNAVTAAKIKKGAVTSSAIKDGDVQSADINIAGLSKVPSAAAADTVGTAITPVSKRVAPSASAGTVGAALAAATEVPLASYGKITLYAKCFLDTGGDVLYGEVFMRTSLDGAAAINTDDRYVGDPDTFLNTNTPEGAREAFSDFRGANSAGATPGSDGAIIGPDGLGLQYRGSIWITHGPVPGTSPLQATTDQCYFNLAAEKLTPTS